VKKFIAASLFWIALTTSACSIPIQPVSVVPTDVFPSVPVLTSTVPPMDDTPLQTTETSAAISALLPEGQPASEWYGIPIMPGAIAGEGDDEGYVFTAKVTPQQVRDYYLLALGKLGWQPMATGEGEPPLVLIFVDGTSTTLTISILSKGDEVLVLLVK
jgi:hypothetical protein